jgi:rubrerythrin
MNERTRENLLEAMQQEAFTYARYMLFAEHARQGGNTELAALFEQTAKEELSEHFTEAAGLAGLVRSDAENVEDAIQRETYGIETAYRDFAQQAFSAGDKAVGDRFEEIRRGEIKHREAFQKCLDKLAKDPFRKW